MFPSMCTIRSYPKCSNVHPVQKAVLVLTEISLRRSFKKHLHVLFKVKLFLFFCDSLPDHRQLTGPGDSEDTGQFDP